MNESREQKKEKTFKKIAHRVTRGIVFLGFFLLLGTCLTAGFIFITENMEVYEDFTFAYAKQAARSVDTDKLKYYVKTGKIDMEYLEFYIHLLSATEAAELKYYYIVIPTEDDLIYVWSVSGDNLGADPMKGFLSHEEYSEGEKETMMQIIKGEYTKKLTIGRYHDEHLGTALYPIIDHDTQKVIALAGVDIVIDELIEALIKLYVNIALAILIVLLICIVVYYRAIRKRIIKPIVTLKKATTELIKDLEEGTDFHVEVHTGDEIEELADSFELMDQRLKKYINENLYITAERERMLTELDLARRIQANMLPKESPDFPTRNDVEIYASMVPAKEIGGDFYDFFFIDEDHLGLTIADVSGKGVPAALFMMMARIMIQNGSMLGNSPKSVLQLVNKQICKNNDENMFVTVWLGILDLSTGILTAANAGHEYPFLKHPKDDFHMFMDKHSFVVGGKDDIEYYEYKLRLFPGSKLFLYTDGLAEARNSDDHMFGTEQIMKTLNQVKDEDAKTILEFMTEIVDGFVGDEPRFDDLTMLCVIYHGNQLPQTNDQLTENSIPEDR